MPTERIEVACPHCRLVGDGDTMEFRKGFCNFCVGTRVQKHPVAPNSLTAARLRLADAAEAWWTPDDNVDVTNEWGAIIAALAEIRAKRT